MGVGRDGLLGLGGGTRRVATALQPCHPLTGHITDTSHRALLRNATVCLSLLTQALHKHCWSPHYSGKTAVTSPISLERAESVEQNPGAFVSPLL